MDTRPQSEIELLKDTNRDLRQAFDQLSALQGLSIKISASQSEKEIVESVMEVIPQIISCYSCQIFFYEKDKFFKAGSAVFHEATGLSPVDQEMVYWACKRAAVSVHPGEGEDTANAIAPMVLGGDIIGAIVLDLGPYYTSYSEITGLALATIASHAALALSHEKSSRLLKTKAADLNDAKEYIGSILTSLTHSLLSLDPDGTIKVFNLKAEEFFEIRSRLVIGQDYHAALPEPLVSVLEKLFQAVQNNESPQPVELKFPGRYQPEKNCLIIASPLKVSGFNKKGMVCICQDMALTKEVKRLQELDKMKDDFISMVSHELKTPLASILAYAETLLKGLAQSPEDQAEHLSVILQEGNRLDKLVNDILDLSKIESGKMQFSFRGFRPAELLEGGMRSAKSLCQRKNQQLLFEAPLELPEISGDFDKLTQVLLNMISNAVKFTGEGGTITLGARLAQKKEEPGIEFFVRDTGIGIEAKNFSKVFDKFSQIEDVRFHSEGTGLGMPISHEILKAHQSGMKLKSKPGEGSEFYFWLKLGQ